jgi:hypothetical protein
MDNVVYVILTYEDEVYIWIHPSYMIIVIFDIGREGESRLLFPKKAGNCSGGSVKLEHFFCS